MGLVVILRNYIHDIGVRFDELEPEFLTEFPRMLFPFCKQPTGVFPFPV